MKDDRCPLTWKAAALEDGRLEGADVASFDLHASRCADCRAEKKALSALYARMRDVTLLELAPLERARMRASLLSRANQRFVGRPRPARARWAALAFIVAAGLVGVVARKRGLPTRGMPSDLATFADREVGEGARLADREVGEATPAHYEVVEAPHAVWRARSAGATERVELADGAARFEVGALGVNQRFVVALPDGELEVHGRRFEVHVALGRTKSVSVADGSVIFRRHAASELVLRGGEGWTRTDAPTATVAPVVAATSRTEAKAAGAPAVAAEPASPTALSALAPSSAPTGADLRAPSSPLAGESFDEAIGSFVHGSYALADAQLLAFARRFPDDARCEDAAFLSAVARWRLGDAQGARSRAEAYLGAYPNGLRRGEARHIVDDAR